MPDPPVEFTLIEFPGEAFRVDLVPALIDLVDTETVQILDLLVVRKDAQGNVTAVEIDELDDDAMEAFTELRGEYDGLLSDQDALLAAESVAPGESAMLVVWQNLWAGRFADAVEAANGAVVAHRRIPAERVRAALDDLAASAAEGLDS